MNGPARRFRVAYASAMATYVAEHGEAELQEAYELGRAAVRMELSVLELAEAHHETLATMARGADDPEKAAALVKAAGEVFLETLSAYEMITRGFAEARGVAQLERRQATVFRRLSAFLTDAALAIGDPQSLHEALQLVAEHARELVPASQCEISWLHHGRSGIRASSVTDGARADHLEILRRPLSSLDGRCLGSITVGRAGPPFTTAEAAVMDQLAQLTSATLERTILYPADVQQ